MNTKLITRGVLLSANLFILVHCTEVRENVDRKWDLLNNKVEKLDSMVDLEINKMNQLDSLIDKEIRKVNQLDSVIKDKSSKLDSVLFRE